MTGRIARTAGTKPSTPCLLGKMLVAMLFLTGCQMAPTRFFDTPPGSQSQPAPTVPSADAQSSPSDLEALEREANALMNSMSTEVVGPEGYGGGTLSAPTNPSLGAMRPRASSAYSTKLVAGPPTSGAHPNQPATSADTQTSNWISGGVPQLSSTAIVRGQSGWVSSNPAAPGTGMVPGPVVNRYQAPPSVPLGSAPGYASTVAPGAIGGQQTIVPGIVSPTDPAFDVPTITAPGGYTPRIEVAPLDVYVQEKRTGRIILGGSVNSDLGVAGQLIIDERNFDIRALPRSWSDLFSGYAFKGAGQSFRIELMPGNQVERYTVNWSTPNLFGYTPYSLSVGGFMFTRQYRDWTERRLGGRVGLGYNITKDLSIGTEVRGENVKISNPRITGVQQLDNVLGKNDLYSVRVSLAHDTRDSAFMATEGSYLQLMYDQAFGSFDYPQGQMNYSRYFRVHERADGLGRHVLAATWKVGVSGTQTPIYENFFAGGFSSMRGFRFRGASPVEGGVQVGGRFMFLGSLEYMFPLTADEMLRGVAFVDYGTVEQKITMTEKNFRVSPGLGLRIAVPMLGPAPLAFDFAVPIADAEGDQHQLLSFYMGFTR